MFPLPLTLHSIRGRPLDLLRRPGLEPALAVMEEMRRRGGRPLLVGGFVRDLLLTGEPPRGDLDVEVQGLSAPETERIIREAGGRVQGRSFAVFALAGVEFALPRRERPTGPGHRDFLVEADPHMPYAEAAARRDLTMNAMALDPWEGRLLDPWGGRIDLAAGILRHTSPRFAEDPLRVLRVMQFAGRFGFAPAPGLIALCRTMSLANLPRERLWEEWKKLLLQGTRPSLGLRFLRRCGALSFFPELQALADTPQDPEWHPEGTVWDHTLLCLDAAAGLRRGEREPDLLLMLGTLCHDFGKPATTYRDEERNRIVSPRHEPEGEAPTRTFLARISGESRLVEQVVPLVRRHLAPNELYKAHRRGADVRSAIRRLALRTDPLLLEKVARADHLGRHTPDARAGDFPAGEFFLARVRELELERSRPAPLVLGRHLLPLGIPPGPAMGRLLDRLFEAQLDGGFDTTEEGLELLARWRREEGR